MCLCHLCESKPFFFCFILKKISLCHTVGSVSELAEKTIYFLFYCSQRMSLLPESWTLEDHLEAWNIPAWLPWGECRPAFQSEGGSRPERDHAALEVDWAKFAMELLKVLEHRGSFVHLSMESWLCSSMRVRICKKLITSSSCPSG